MIGTAEWTRRTGGRLSPSERRALLRPLMGGLIDMAVGRTRMAVGLHPGRRSTVEPDALQPPDSQLARAADEAAAELLSPVLLHHSQRTYAFGAAIGALEGLAFDRELLYVAAMLHDTGLPTPTEGVDFTVRSADLADHVTVQHGVPDERRERIADAICLHHSPGITRAHGAEAYLLSTGAAVDVFGLRTWDLPDTLRHTIVDRFPRQGFKREFTRLWRIESARVPAGRAQLLRRYALADLTIRLAPYKG